jgi:hypothetical protein
MFRNKISAFLAVAVVAGSATPAVCQNRFMDEAKEKAQRREENKAVREAEHPEATQTANANPAKKPQLSPAPAATAPAAPAAPAEPAAPAAPAATLAQ